MIDFALTGMPRAGTTYLAAVLHHPPEVVVLSEAGGRWKRLFGEAPDGSRLGEVFTSFRERVSRGEPVATFEGTPGFAGEGRIDTWNQPKSTRAIATHGAFAFGMKNPEVFLAWLGVILERMRCVISVRHPIGVINSWVAHAGGSAAGTFADGTSVVFSSSAAEALERRIELHNRFAEMILAAREHPGAMIVRYEDWFTDPEHLPRVGRFLGVPVPPRLHPPPIAPEPVSLAPSEQERILAGCAIAAELGYPCEGGRLRAIEPPCPSACS
jgi:hypothetical protein